MAIKLEKRFVVNAPVDKVCAAMRDPKLIERDEKTRDVLEVEITDKKKTKTEHHYEIRSVNYYRTLTGIDKTKTEQNFVNVQWDVKNAVSHWTWRGTNENAKRANVKGSYAVLPKGDGAEMVLTAEIDIAVPLIGNKIAQKVADVFSKEWPKYHQLVIEWTKSA